MRWIVGTCTKLACGVDINSMHVRVDAGEDYVTYDRPEIPFSVGSKFSQLDLKTLTICSPCRVT